ncbi:MAG: hypothetical protein PWQ57_896 [Desulfovibrionales bacterium]|jgi:hypothetical protein|nr:hypothetical protein [Desulfovibrionales bacterium]
MTEVWEIARVGLSAMSGLVVPLAGWMLKQHLAMRKEITDLRRAKERLEDRVSRNEARLEDKPGPAALHELSLAVQALRGDLRAIDEKLNGTCQLVTRLDRVMERQEAYLLNKGG